MVLEMDLTGKMVVVIGIGRILYGMFTRTLARVGMVVVLLNIDLETAEEVARDIWEVGGTVAVHGVDVMDKEMPGSVHARVPAQLEPCGILTNGTGGNQVRANTSKEYSEMGNIEADVATFSNMGYRGVQGILDPNFLGGLLTCQVSTKGTVGREGCNIVNTFSISAARPLTRMPVYSGTAVVLSNFTQWPAVHSARVGICINVIALGFFVTRQNKGLPYDEGGKSAARIARVLAATPMGWFGKPKELGGALVFLLNNEVAGFITGVVLSVDSGFSAYSEV